VVLPRGTARSDVNTSRFTDLERQTISEHHWWSTEELLRTHDVARLGSLLVALLRDGPPPATIEIE
jgi:hypothetical protein